MGPILARGKVLAEKLDAYQLRFTENWPDANGADLLIASGSLHYFETPLPRMVLELPNMPEYILINRTPLSEGIPVATVQDGVTYRVGCMLYNRLDLIRDFEQIGYRVMDAWQTAELSLDIPGYPEHAIAAYSGLFLRRERCPEHGTRIIPKDGSKVILRINPWRRWIAISLCCR